MQTSATHSFRSACYRRLIRRQRLVSSARRLVSAVALASLALASANAQTVPSYVLGSPLLPLLLQAPDNGWLKVNANRYRDVWTPPDLEPLFGSVTASPATIIAAWSGFAWDSNRGDIILYGGGHANYSGNDVYRWHSSTLRWERASLPSEIRFDPVADFQAIDGVDNAPSSAHTYKNNTFLPIVDRFLTWGGAVYSRGGPYLRVSESNPTQARNTGPYLFDPNRADGNKVGGSTGSHVQRVAPHPEIVGGRMWQNRDMPKNLAGQAMPFLHRDGCSAYASENGHDVVYVGAYNFSSTDMDLYRYQVTTVADPTQDTIAKVGMFVNGGGGTSVCAYDPSRKLFVRTKSNAAPFVFWDVNAASPTNPDHVVKIDATIAGLQTWLAAQSLDIKNCGIEYDAARGTFPIWCGGTTVWDLNAPAAANTESGWTVAQRASPSRSAPPMPQNGVLGKWRYAPYYDVFVALQDINDGNVWIYKPAGWVQPNPAGNRLPSVAIASPSTGSSVAPGTSVSLTASATDSDGTVGRVEYYVNGAKIGQSSTPPYAVPYAPTLVGDYSIVAIAVDNVGGMAKSTVSLSVHANVTTATLARGSGNAVVADTFLDAWMPTTSHGNSDQLFLDSSHYAPLLRFTIFQSEGGPVPDHAVVQSATLSLYKQFYDGTLRLDPLLEAWDENRTTWSERLAGAPWNAPGAAGAGSDYAGTSDAIINVPFDPGWVQFDVTSAVQRWANSGGNFGWRITQLDSGYYAKQFDSSEFADSTRRPNLTIAYAPPSSGTPPPDNIPPPNTPPPGNVSTNVALVANGGVASASSSGGSLRQRRGQPLANGVQYVNDGERSGAGWSTGGGGWTDGTPGVFPDYVEIDFSGAKTLDHVVVYSPQDDLQNPVEPTDTMTFTQYGATAFDVQGWNGASWVTLASITGNNLVKRTVPFPALSTNRIRVVVNDVADHRSSRITEVEAWTGGSAPSPPSTPPSTQRRRRSPQGQ